MTAAGLTVDADLIIVGAGPVGLACALHARRAGLSCLVLERRPLEASALDKACGEGLMPTALRELASLGIDPPGHPITGITYVDGRGRSVHGRFRAGAGRGVRRTSLAQAMLTAAGHAGAGIIRHRVRRLSQDCRGVNVDGFRAHHVIAADGLHSPLRALLGLERPARWPIRYGLRAHLRIAPWTSHVEVHWRPEAELYLTPVSPTEVGVAVLTTQRGVGWQQWCERFPGAARLRQAAVVSTVRGVSGLEQRAGRQRSGRVLLVGDAAGYVDALTGEGIASGLLSARAAVAALTTDGLSEYERVLHRLTRRSRWLTAGLLRTTSTGVGRSAVLTGARVPGVFPRVVNLLA